MSSEKQYIGLFNACRSAIDSHSSPLLNGRRDAAFRHFCETGFPSRRVERYRYSDMDKLFQPDFGLNINRLNIPVNPYDAFRCDVPNLSTLLFFVVNDAFYDQQQPRCQLPDGVYVGAAGRAPEPVLRAVGSRYDALADHSDGPTALNTMLAQDCLLVYFPRHTRMEKTLQVINILRSDVDLMVARRVLIVLEEDAEATILFCDHAADDRRFLTNEVTEIFLSPGARLRYYSLEETHARNVRIANTFVRQEERSLIDHNLFTLHNGTTRNRVDVALEGEGAECSMGGCVIVDKTQHADNNTLIAHHAQHCQSHQLYKYVAGESAVGAFAGKVLVAEGAQKTVSQMSNQNLVTSPEAHVYAQPMLEIYADDVKCGHGSTVGQLNDAALFYMRQRGIPLDEARMLLQLAFVGEVVDRITLIPLRDRLRHLVDKRFRGELNKCAGCRLCK